MESIGIIRVSRVHTWQKPCHSRLLSLSPHIQSINKSYVSSAFRTYLEFSRPSSPSWTQGAVISSELWQSSPNLTSCSCPRDLQPVLHTTTSLPRAEHVRPLPEPSSGLPCRWGWGEPLLLPSPPGVLMVWLLLTFSTSFPATLPEAVPSVSLLSGFLITS